MAPTNSNKMNITENFSFYVNDIKRTVDVSKFSPKTSLNTFLRDTLLLTGTKKMCVEGGCGVCVVTVRRYKPHDGTIETVAVNSCLVPLFQCNGWYIYTVEGIGTSTNIHPIQNILAKFNGTQCGYCTPGMVMNMYSLYMSNPNLTMKDVENSFGGNICRCTGYRPILSAFKTLCEDASPDLLGSYPDIEELKSCKSNGSSCKSTSCGKRTACGKTNGSDPICFQQNGDTWIKVSRLDDLLLALKTFSESDYMLVAGNTAKGVYKQDPLPPVFVDIFDVSELKTVRKESNSLRLGGNVTLTDAMVAFREYCKENGFGHLEKMADHIDLIANVPVRNTGTIAGNLMIKHRHHEFPSDVFLILETSQATLEIIDGCGQKYLARPSEFLKVDMKGKIIRSVLLPALTKQHRYASYKIMPRAQNAHALVNAGFLFKIGNDGIVDEAKIIYGCINEEFVHAERTEKFLLNNKLFFNETLQEAYKILEQELICQVFPAEPKPEFRKQLAIALFYKFILSVAPENLVPQSYKSGATLLRRPISKGSQDFETKESLYPLSMPLNKVESIAQVTGEAEYVMDTPNPPNQLFAVFVLAKSPPNSKIIKIDTTKALAKEGVITFLDKSSIPGKNTFTPIPSVKNTYVIVEEELFCGGTVKYYDQPVGVIVASSLEVAEEASTLVEISFEEPKDKPLITIKDIVERNATHRVEQYEIIEPKKKGENVKNIVKGTFDSSWQYHFHMETQCCSVVPTEDGINIFPVTQWMDLTQSAAAAALNIPANKINVSVRRCGGSFGAKISRNAMISTACSLAAYVLKKPVKMATTIETNMRAIGKRYPLSSNYEVATDNEGVIQYLNNDFYYDYGKDGGNDGIIYFLMKMFFAQYKHESWFINSKLTYTDTHPACYIRAPGFAEGFAMLECMMEHAAVSLNMDPLQFRLANLKDGHPKLLEHIKDFLKWAEIDSRKSEIEEFNGKSRWRKRGISVLPLIYPIDILFSYGVIVSIYAADGSVAISHGGIEVGQGINTKVAQVCAHKFGISLDKIQVKPSNNLIAANSMPTGGSTTSESVCLGVLKACDILLKRMEPIKAKMDNPTWETLIANCYDHLIHLTATSSNVPNEEKGIEAYDVYAVAASEVEVDILTGQYLVKRVDILEDVGNSMNPALDIGQVEGAFTMGQGLFTTEQILASAEGEVLTDRTWSYKPPGARDIPADFRIKFPKNNPNPVGVLKSKATGEPPFCLAVSIPFAIRHAVASARLDADKTNPKWYAMDGPSTVENTFMNCLNDYSHYKLA